MTKLGVEKSLSLITGAFEGLIEATEGPGRASRRNTVRETDEQLIRVFEEGCYPGGSYVF
jgi:hypothetical protein